MNSHLERALIHLRKDQKLVKILNEVDPRLATYDRDLYLSLLRAITGQQLSVKAAKTIWLRFLESFQNQYPTPSLVLDRSNEALKSCGLSNQKANYIKNIAQFEREGKLQSELIQKMSDQEVIDHLTQIKGVGKWTAEMLLMTALGRNDVFPIDDLGIRQAMALLYNVSIEHKRDYQKLNEIAEHWSPYRSVACFALWQWKDLVK